MGKHKHTHTEIPNPPDSFRRDEGELTRLIWMIPGLSKRETEDPFTKADREKQERVEKNDGRQQKNLQKVGTDG
jgi:hypothetical protein